MDPLGQEPRSGELPKFFIPFIGFAFGLAFLSILIGCLDKKGLLKRKVAATSDDTDQARPPQQLIWSDHNQTEVEISPPEVSQTVRNKQLVESATMERLMREIENEKPIRFSAYEIEALTNSFSTVLGSGGFGTVYKGEFMKAVPVAVKVLRGNWNKRMEEQFMAEVSAVGRANHINLVRLYGFCSERDVRALVYEFMENGSLDHLLFDAKRAVEWEKLREIAIGTAKGLAYLHEECRKRIIHYDIKPANILLDGDLRPKVSDFGLAKLCSIDVSLITMTGCRGTPGYAAPELWEPFPVSHKCDVYSFGIVLFEIIARRRHHDLNEEDETKQWLPRWAWHAFNNGDLTSMLSEWGIEERHMENAVRMAQTALWCIQYRPEARPKLSNLGKMLEGDLEIEPPPFPFKNVQGIIPGFSSATSESVDS